MNKWRILWTGNQMAGNEPAQNRKNETKSAVVVPESGAKLFGILSRSYWG